MNPSSTTDAQRPPGHGAAAGAALALACYCDLRFAASGAKLTTAAQAVTGARRRMQQMSRMQQMMGAPDFAEAVAARRQGRPPRFTDPA